MNAAYEYPPSWDIQHHPDCEDGKWYWCEMGKHHIRGPSNFCMTDYYPARTTDDCVCDLIGETK